MDQRRQRAALTCAILVLGTSLCWVGCSGDETTSSSTGTTPQSFGPPGTDIVSAGGIASNREYKLIFTLGQSTQNQGKMTNSAYRLQGGVLGANGSVP